MPGKKIGDLDVYDDVNTDKSRRDLLEISKNTGTYGSPTYATNGSRKITIEQLKETLFIKDINSYNQVTTGSPTFDKQAYNGIANAGTYTLPTSVGSYEVLAIILEAELNVTVNGLGTGISDLVFTKQNETALLIDTVYGWLPLAVNKEVNSSAFELLANKENTTLDTSSTKYPTNNLVKTYVDNLGNTLTSGLATKLTIANNLSDLTNTTQARDNLLLGATNDVTHNSITLSNTTVSTLPFINTAKKIISATGALLGTWFQTLTADTNPVDADTIVVNDSTASFEAKKTTLLQLWTNYLLAKVQALGYLVVSGLTNNVVSKWNGLTFVNSTITDNGTTITLGTNTTINGNITMPINGQIDVTSNYLQLGFKSTTAGVLIGRVGGDMIFYGTSSTNLKFNNGFGLDNTTNQVNYRSSNSVDNGKLDGSTYTMHRGEQCFRHSIVLSPNTQITPNASSQLELASTTKGFLKNRVTTSQKTSISSPANGLNVYDTDLATDSSYTTRGSINAWIDSKIKFSELFDPFLIDQQVSPAGTAYVAVFRPKSDMILTAIEFLVTIFGSSESFYVGIYNQALTSKLSDGTATVSATGFTQISVTPIKLTGATVYYLVLKDNAGGTNSVGCGSSYNNTLICSSKFIGAGALPADLTSGGSPTADTKAPYLGVISL